MQSQKRRRVVMRQTHRSGEKLFSDYTGKKPHWIDKMTGEVYEAEPFVAALGSSKYTYATRGARLASPPTRRRPARPYSTACLTSGAMERMWGRVPAVSIKPTQGRTPT
ncbi:MAG: hypothetical protein ACHQ9S_26675 [Candidatus Binatia bacterium]